MTNLRLALLAIAFVVVALLVSRGSCTGSIVPPLVSIGKVITIGGCS